MGPRILSLVALALGVATTSQALDWPAAAPVAVEFGGPNAGSPIQGIVMSGSGVDIRASEAGELVFERATNDFHTKLPSATGETLVLEGGHGLASVYAYLPSVADPGAENFVSDALIGKSGPAGLLDADGFMFALYDRKAGRWVNPRVFLPKSDDAKAPLIRKVSLESKGKIWVLGDSKSIPQGSYSIIVDTAEQGTGTQGLVIGPPWYLRVLVNGEKVVEARTEIAEAKNGVLSFYPSPREGASIVIDGNGSVRVPPRSFSRGKSVIELLVRDFAGNERSAAWTLLFE